MPLSFLLDEHLRGTLWRAIQHHNATPTEFILGTCGLRK